jgi:hypothetical protein
VRPLLAYLIASAVGATALLLPNLFAYERPGANEFVMTWLVVVATIVVAAALPAALAAWAFRRTNAPRPLADILAGAVLGPALFVVLRLILITWVEGLPYPSPPELDQYVIRGIAGALGGLAYGLIAGRRA